MLSSQLRMKSASTGRLERKLKRWSEGTWMDELRIKISVRDETPEGCHPYRLCYGMMMKLTWRNEELHQDRHLHRSHGIFLSRRPRRAHRSIRMNHLRIALMAAPILRWFQQEVPSRRQMITRIHHHFCRLHKTSTWGTYQAHQTRI